MVSLRSGVRTDNGPELAGRALDPWCFAEGVEIWQAHKLSETHLKVLQKNGTLKTQRQFHYPWTHYSAGSLRKPFKAGEFMGQILYRAIRSTRIVSEKSRKKRGRRFCLQFEPALISRHREPSTLASNPRDCLNVSKVGHIGITVPVR